MFMQREKQLTMRHRNFEERLMQRQAEVEHLRDRLRTEIAEREQKLQQALVDLTLEK